MGVARPGSASSSAGIVVAVDGWKGSSPGGASLICGFPASRWLGVGLGWSGVWIGWVGVTPGTSCMRPGVVGVVIVCVAPG